MGADPEEERPGSADSLMPGHPRLGHPGAVAPAAGQSGTIPSGADRSEGDREAGRRRRGVAVAWAVLGLVVVAVGAFVATRSELLDVDEVRLVGVSADLGEGTVLEAFAVAVGSPMVGLDLDAAARRVAAIPRVAGVEVERDWPGSVVLWVVERVPVVNASSPDGGWAILDAEGMVLEHVDGADPSLPTVRVDGVGRPGVRLSGLGPLLDAADAVTDDLAPWIVALVPTGEGVRAELVGGVDANLGLGNDYRDEVRALVTVLHRVDLSCIVGIDVSVHDIPVVRRDDLHCS